MWDGQVCLVSIKAVLVRPIDRDCRNNNRGTARFDEHIDKLWQRLSLSALCWHSKKTLQVLHKSECGFLVLEVQLKLTYCVSQREAGLIQLCGSLSLQPLHLALAILYYPRVLDQDVSFC